MSNASNTMVRRATELDVGVRIIVGGAIRTVVEIYDHIQAHGCFVTIKLDNGCAIVDWAGTTFTCLAVL